MTNWGSRLRVPQVGTTLQVPTPILNKQVVTRRLISFQLVVFGRLAAAAALLDDPVPGSPGARSRTPPHWPAGQPT
jgi:hypothetical protein